ncbi:MAG: FHA domain-containing protein [Bdellovibrionaceae bacterium]|nr:FHA domain-containing protein [Bdellovibrionales bacterium]MCB9086389.1 FHA domain-containing protein [Pseudobdellovibrionaceae bacterium]
MARIRLKLHGKDVSVIDLVDGQEYISGRSQDCHIPLANQKGISRHHLKIYQDGDAWIAQLISRYGCLIYEGTEAEAIQLMDGTAFQVPPYEFVFVDTETPSAELAPIQTEDQPASPGKTNLTSASTSTAPTSAMPTPYGNGPGIPPAKQPPGNGLVPSGGGIPGIGGEHLPEGNLEATSPGLTDLTPYLRIRYPGHDRDDVLELEGNLWVAGRDANCEIPIDDGHVSRRHFELTQTNEGIYITDLGSANGTEVNGQPITPHEPFRLNSGDRIAIMDLTVVMELRDTNFKNKMMVVGDLPPPQVPATVDFNAPMPFNPNLYFDPEGPSAVKLGAPEPTGAKAFFIGLKKNKVRMALVVLVPLVLIGLMMPDKPKNGQTENSSQENGLLFENLTPEQKSAVKDIFNLARNHYTQGRYELCLAELNKLHEIIPFYEDSKSLQTHCVSGSEMTRENQELERKERMRLEAQQRIQYIVTECRTKLGNDASMDAAKECLGPAIELDPTDAGIMEILTAIEAREEQERQQMMQKNALQSRARAGESQYNKAKNLFQKGRLRDSIKEYERYLSGGFPDLKGLNPTAKRELASVRKQLDVKVQDKLSLCKSHYEKKNYKPAIEACNAALGEDPTHKEANSTKASVLSDLRREMKAIYEDSVLEESLGEIEGAKEKWKKIIQNDIESDDYYQKAKRKLRKYGIGM